jgi:hypothetical protein
MIIQFTPMIWLVASTLIEVQITPHEVLPLEWQIVVRTKMGAYFRDPQARSFEGSQVRAQEIVALVEQSRPGSMVPVGLTWQPTNPQQYWWPVPL